MNPIKRKALIAGNNQGSIMINTNDHYIPNRLFSASARTVFLSAIRPTQTTNQGVDHA